MSQMETKQPHVETVAKPDVPAGTSKEFAEVLAKTTQVPVINGEFAPDSLDAYWRVAGTYIRGGMVPRGLEGKSPMETQSRVTMCLEAGAGLGLSCSQSMAGMMVVNNKPAIYGDVLPGLIRASGKCIGIEETVEGDGESLSAVCVMERIHTLPDGSCKVEKIARRFSVADAKRASLWGKTGPWSQYPRRMLQIRARAWAGRDGFADILMGFDVAEEYGYTRDTEPSAALTHARERIAAAPAAQNGPAARVADPVVPVIDAQPSAPNEPEANGDSQDDYDGDDLGFLTKATPTTPGATEPPAKTITARTPRR